MRCLIANSTFPTCDSLRMAERPLIEMLEARLVLSAMSGLADEVPVITPKLTWAMPARYGIDSNKNQLVDLPNSYSYANPTGYKVYLDGTPTISTLPVATYRWTISGNGLNTPLMKTGAKVSYTGMKLGAYTLKLEVTDQQNNTASVTGTIKLKDMLVVSLGDSYGSGEGNIENEYERKDNPTIPPKWADGLTPAMTLENAQAHRSTKSAAAQWALKLEKGDPHFSVTFIQLAATGATIPNIYSASLKGIDGKYLLQPQLTELKQIVGDRKIDIMTISAGGNDIEFQKRVKQLLLHVPAVPPFKPETPPFLPTIKKEVDAELALLPARFQTLRGRIEQNFSVRKVFLTEYPDPTRDSSGNFTTFATDYISPLKVDKIEAKFAFNSILAPLNQRVSAAAAANGWTFVNGVAAAYKTHGYASSSRWFRTEDEAAGLQGAEVVVSGDTKVSIGGMHPNLIGNATVGKLLMSKLDEAFWIGFLA